MRNELTPYEKRKTLWRQARIKESEIKWPTLIAACVGRAEAALQEVVRPYTPKKKSVKADARLIRYRVVMGGSVAIFFSFAVAENSLTLFAALAATGIAVGAAALIKGRNEKASTVNPLTMIRIDLPAPVQYHLQSTLGKEGEVIAKIKKRYPEIKFDWAYGYERTNGISYRENTIGNILIGIDQTSGEITERFQELEEEVSALNIAAKKRCEKAIKNANLDEEKRIELQGEFRARAEAAIERRQLHRGVMESLNRSA